MLYHGATILKRVPLAGKTKFYARCFGTTTREGVSGVIPSTHPSPRRSCCTADRMSAKFERRGECRSSTIANHRWKRVENFILFYFLSLYLLNHVRITDWEGWKILFYFIFRIAGEGWKIFLYCILFYCCSRDNVDTPIREICFINKFFARIFTKFSNTMIRSIGLSDGREATGLRTDRME